MTYADELERYMLELVNAERALNGLHALKLELNLNSAAEDHSLWMLDTNTFSHTGEDGSTSTERIIASGFDYVGTRGTSENIAYIQTGAPEGYFDEVEDRHIAFMNSPGHRANILHATRDYIGIGIEIGSFTNDQGVTAEVVMVAQSFGRTEGTVDLDNLSGSAGTPVIEEPVAVDETDADQIIQGTDGADTLVGSNGNDTISGGAGDDTLSGGDGDDVLAGSSGNDVSFGGTGNDNMGGGTGNDVMDGGIGNDTMGGGFGDDSMSGGDGDDGVFGGANNDVLEGGAGNDNIAGSYGNDLLNGGTGDDNMGGGTGQDTLMGGEGNDTIGGGEGSDLIDGGAGNDFLAGGGRDDIIYGGTGNDSINAGGDDDTITGGAGNDTFIFTEFTSGERDTVTDWTNGEDVFLLTGITNAPGSGLQGRVDALDITAVAGGVEFGFNGHTIFLQGASAGDLGVEDFIFV
jgi:Ca2+-binding RTX toxin-like protein